MEKKFHRIYWNKKFNWKDYAKLYNRYTNTKNNYYENSAKYLIQNSGIKKTDLLADLGCGTGVLTKEVIRVFSKINIIAIDISKDILKEYKKNFKKEIKRDQIKVIKGNAEKSEKYLRKKVDKIFISSSLWDMDLDALFKSLPKIMKPETKIIANLPSLVANEKKGFIYYLEKTFGKEKILQKGYRRIPLKELSRILRRNKLKIEKRRRYEFKLDKKNLVEFFKILRYRYPFIFLSEKIPYKERYEKCKRIFDKMIKDMPKKGIKETGYVLVIRKIF